MCQNIGLLHRLDKVQVEGVRAHFYIGYFAAKNKKRGWWWDFPSGLDTFTCLLVSFIQRSVYLSSFLKLFWKNCWKKKNLWRNGASVSQSTARKWFHSFVSRCLIKHDHILQCTTTLRRANNNRPETIPITSDNQAVCRKKNLISPPDVPLLVSRLPMSR